MDAYGTKVYYNIFDQVADRLYNRLHASTKFRPKDVKPENIDEIVANLYTKVAMMLKKKIPFSVGAIVGVASNRLLFNKSFQKHYKPTFSDQLFRIKSIQTHSSVAVFIIIL